MSDSSDHTRWPLPPPAFRPCKRVAFTNGFGVDKNSQHTEFQATKDENTSLQMKNQDLIAHNAILQNTMREWQVVHDANKSDEQKYDFILNKMRIEQERIREFEAKLAEPLLDKATIERLVREDEDLRLQRSTALNNVLRAEKIAAEAYQKIVASREEWSKSIWHWQDLQDIRSKGPATRWTTKNVFDNRHYEFAVLKESWRQKKRRIDETRDLLEKIGEQRIEAWRDVVLGKLEKQEIQRWRDESDEENEDSVISFVDDVEVEPMQGSDAGTDPVPELVWDGI